MSKWQLVHIHKVTENDGTLYVMEDGNQVPFDIKRIFLVANVASGKSRGDHATKKTRLILFPVAGSCKVVVDDGEQKEAFIMNDPSTGLLIEPMVWRSMQEFTSDCVMMAVCDRVFEPGNETYDDYNQFLNELNKLDPKPEF